MASEETKVEGTSTEVKPEPKPVDERAVSLANAQETALARSAQLEGEIEASKTLAVYAAAGLAHVETVKCWKASIDYSCEKRGVTTSWNPAQYDSAIGQITIRVRATNPELFEDFDALNEKSTKPPSLSNERISTRLRVGILYNLLVDLIGDKVGKLPYRLAANYLVGPAILTFSKQDVKGTIHESHAEFLKTQLGLLCDGKSSSASFLAALKQHYADQEKEASDKADASLTPEQRKLRKQAADEGAKAASSEKEVSKVREALVKNLASACAGMVSPNEIAEMIRDAAKKAQVVIPIGKLNPINVTKDELSSFLKQVAEKGGRSKEERNALRMVIVRHGSLLAESANKRKEQVASTKPQLAAAATN
jgi:hypothetical protein